MRSALLLGARAVVGGYLAVHGAQKLFGAFGGPGLDKAAAGFERIGLAPGRQMAALAGVTELGGGLLTAAGLADPAGPLAIIGAMTVAAATHRANGPLAAKGVRAAADQRSRGGRSCRRRAGPAQDRPAAAPAAYHGRRRDRRDHGGRLASQDGKRSARRSRQLAGRGPLRPAPPATEDGLAGTNPAHCQPGRARGVSMQSGRRGLSWAGLRPAGAWQAGGPAAARR
jgi:uncharacterized membrane protein YphA (DoxX/SURF4 family)